MHKANSQNKNQFNQFAPGEFRPRHWLTKVAALFTVLWVMLHSPFGFAFWNGAFPAAAQSSNENWTTPVNLSRSGAASDPLFVVSPTGQFHVIWRDNFLGNIHTVGDGAQWSEPAPVRFPFGVFNPVFVTDANGTMHAFWQDDQNILFHSRVNAENFATSNAWSPAQRLAEAVMDVDVTVDSAGRVHFSYVQALDTTRQPAGLYYQRSRDRFGWTTPVLLYESPYFRSLSRENANVKVATSGAEENEKVFVAWDNPARERVFITRSLDSGETWEPPLEIDAPADGSVAGGPSRVLVSAQGENVLLIWQTNIRGANCQQYYQLSSDGGVTWQIRERMLNELPGCPQGNQIMHGENGMTLLMVMVNSQMYLLAWDGASWSNPQLQGPLTSFTDPDTFKPVEFGCHQARLIGGQTLFVVGCDTGGGQDIWFTSRNLENTSTWFSEAPLWNSPDTLAASPGQLLTPALVSDANNRIHAFWSQADATLAGGTGMVIFYARLEAGQWSEPVAVLSTPDGLARQPAAAVDANGQLSLVWSGGQSGQIYFSQASAARAVVASAWSDPQPLPSPQTIGSSPDILVDLHGTIHVVYAIPFNEQRGIYATQSSDGGQTWSDPVIIFDAAAAGWAMVDNPRLALTGRNQLHLLWTRFSTPSNTGSLGLYYSRSEDGGLSWSQAATVVEKRVLWSKIIGFGDTTVHRVWQEFSNGRMTLWHEESLDGGTNWQRIAPVSIFGETIGEPSLASDITGRLHLLQTVSRGPTGLGTLSFVLQHWVYDGQSWVSERSLDLGNAVAFDLEDLVATVSSDGNLAVSFSALVIHPEEGQQQDNLFIASRPLELPEIQPTQQVEATLIPQVTLTPTAEVMATASPTASTAAASLPDNQLPPQPDQPGNAWLGSVVGPLAAGLIVLVVFIVGVRGVGLRKR